MSGHQNKKQQMNTDEQHLQYVDNLVSIVTPAYNTSEYIVETMESVHAQTYHNWEMLIVNDCSIDNTAKIVQSYAAKDKRIKLINLKQNSGAAIARNTAIQNAKGRYIAFLDSDDLWKKEKLQKQLKFMQQNGYAFTFTAYELFKSNKENIKNIKNIVPAAIKLKYSDALKGNQIGCLTVMLDRKQISKIEFIEQKHEDYILWLNILKTGITAYGINESLALYRTGNSKSISSNKMQSALWTWNVYRKVQKLSIAQSIYYMCFYIMNGIRKHR